LTARQAAADILHRSVSREGFVADLIDDQLARAPLSPQDRRFVTQLVFGVVRRRATLDALVRPFVNRAPSTVDDRLWDVLHLGAFQLAFLTHVPKHAAVNETVSLAAHVGSSNATGFVNGVLRRVADLITDGFTESPGAAALPFDVHEVQGPEGREQRPRFRVLAVPMLPDPVADPVEYLAAGFSWPKWLAARWHARYGDWEAARLGFWFNAAPPLWVRTNKLRTDRENYRLQLAAAMIDAEPGPHPQSLRFTEHHSVRDLPGYAAGDFAVQDHSSMLVASALAPQPGNRVLDLCSAPGGKTTHLAELADNRAKIVACDPDARRLETVMALCQRLGIKGVETVQLKEGQELPAGPFDAALVDVPCSNTGVLGRRPEVRWRLKPTEFEHLIRLQTRLLFQAIERVKPGGVVVYSTCSIEPDENEGVIAAVRHGIPALKVEAEHHSVPGRPADGGYWARLRVPRVAPFRG